MQYVCVCLCTHMPKKKKDGEKYLDAGSWPPLSYANALAGDAGACTRGNPRAGT